MYTPVCFCFFWGGELPRTVELHPTPNFCSWGYFRLTDGSLGSSYCGYGTVGVGSNPARPSKLELMAICPHPLQDGRMVVFEIFPLRLTSSDLCRKSAISRTFQRNTKKQIWVPKNRCAMRWVPRSDITYHLFLGLSWGMRSTRLTSNQRRLLPADLSSYPRITDLIIRPTVRITSRDSVENRRWFCWRRRGRGANKKGEKIIITVTKIPKWL